MLVVVLIIGILTAFALPQYTKAVEKSLLASILPMVNAIQKELEMFFLSGGNSYLDYVGASESGKGVLMTESSCKTITIDGSAHCYGKNFSYSIWSSEYGYFLAFQRR